MQLDNQEVARPPVAESLQVVVCRPTAASRGKLAWRPDCEPHVNAVSPMSGNRVRNLHSHQWFPVVPHDYFKKDPQSYSIAPSSRPKLLKLRPSSHSIYKPRRGADTATNQEQLSSTYEPWSKLVIMCPLKGSHRIFIYSPHEEF